MSMISNFEDEPTFREDDSLLIGFAEARGRKRALLAEQHDAWESGQPPAPEDLLARWPTDAKTDPDAASLLVADFFLRRDRGDQPSLREYEERFPEHGRSFAGLLSNLNLMKLIGGATE